MSHVINIPRTDLEPWSTDRLLEHFRPVLARVRGRAVENERLRRLAHEEVAALRDAGFGRLRVPAEHGGFGASWSQLVEVLIELARADSNLAQALRGHIGFVEMVLARPDDDYRTFWLDEIGRGALVGNAVSERTGAFNEPGTRITEQDGTLRLNGRKYYTTGSVYADWLVVGVMHPDDATARLHYAHVRTDEEGVRIHDDWDGFGQRLTGSGTTELVDVTVEPWLLVSDPRADVAAGGRAGSTLNAVYQVVHLATLAGIGLAALDEAVAYVRSRTRNFYAPQFRPTEDPVSLQIVGETYGYAETVRASVLAAATTVDRTIEAERAGQATVADYEHTDAQVFGIQAPVIDLITRLTSRVFEVGGASAVSGSRQLDRLWRNARTVGSHNPALHRQRAVGDYLVNGTSPSGGVPGSTAAGAPRQG